MLRRRSVRTVGARGSRPAVERFEERLLLATFVVGTTADNGDNASPTAGSLREAILLANANPGEDRIEFAIGTGPQTITPPSALPSLTDPVEIDGTTQPGGSGTPLIELNGSSAGFADGLRIATTQSTVRALVINRFGDDGIEITGDGNRVLGSFIGTDRSGTLDFGNADDGITLSGRDNSIGGSAPGEGNVLSGNGFAGIYISSSSSRTNTVIQGNLIGTDASGLLPLGNGRMGVRVTGSQNVVGGTGAGEGNTIAFNGAAGVVVGTSAFSSDRNNAIRGNSIVSNGALGIDLGDNGVTLNDADDLDEGPNLRQNFPVIDAAFPSPSGSGTSVQGRLASRPGMSYAMDFFASDTPDSSGFGEGMTFLGSIVVMTDEDGRAAFAEDLPVDLPPGRFLTATTTDAAGNTSEFSEARLVLDEARADLEASITLPGFARSGDELTFSASVENLGPARATGSTLRVPLPSGFSFVAAQPTRGTAAFDDGVVTVSAGTLLPGESAEVSIRAVPADSGVVTISATGVSEQVDPVEANSTATASLDIQPTQPANLVLESFLSMSPAILGRSFESTLIVSNRGPNDQATGVVVSTDLPEGFELVGILPSQGSASRDGQTVRVDFGSLAEGSNAVVRLTLLPSVVGTFDLTSSASGDQPDPNNLDNFVRTTIDVVPAPPADMSVSISSAPVSPRAGETISFTVPVTNFGPGDAEQVVLTNDLPQGVELVGNPSVTQGTVGVVDGVIRADFGALVPGGQALLSFQIRADSPGFLSNVASVTTDRPDPNPLNNRANQVINVRAADPSDVSVGIITVPRPAPVGQALKYSVIASNAGPAEAVGTMVRLPLPSGVELTGIRPSQGSASIDEDGVLTIDLGSIAPGGQALIDVTVVPRALGPLELTATIEASGPDFNPVDNLAVSRTDAVAAEVAPVVSGQQLISSPRGISSIVLAFSRPLDPALATIPSNYAIRLAGADGRALGRSIGIRSASYDPLSRTVTLVPSRALPLGRFFLLQANAPGGPGLTGEDGSVLDGDFNNLPDGIYEDLIGRGTHTRPRRVQRGPLSRELPPAAPPAPLPPAPLGGARPFAAFLAARAQRLAARGAGEADGG